MDDKQHEILRALEDELIRLNQAADLAETLYTDGDPREYVIDGMIAHSRSLMRIFQEVLKLM